MTLRRNTAEGQSSGTTLTAANSGGGSGDAFATVGVTGTASVAFSNATAMHGSNCYDFQAVAGAAIIASFSHAGATQEAFQFYFRLPALLSAYTNIAQFRSASGNAAKVMLSPGNKLIIQDATGLNLNTFATTLLANTWYRVECEVIPGTTTTNGTINCRYYLGDAAEGSPVDAAYASGATVNAGTATLTTPEYGITYASAAGTTHVLIDDAAANDGTSTPIPVGSATVPGPPTAITPTAGNASVSVAFTAPSNNGGSAITQYTATVTDTVTSNVFTSNNPTSPIVIPGLVNGNLCSVTVHATNSVGNSAESSAATFTPATVPGVPTIGVASPGVTQAFVAFTPPASNGGSVITGYTVTSTPGSFTGTGASSPITVSGLTNGTAYTFTVHATNAVGSSAESPASNSITPVTGTNLIRTRRSGAWVQNTPVKIRRSAAWTQVL